MKATRQPRHWVEPFVLSFLILTPLLLVIMGLLCITPLRAGPAPASPPSSEPDTVSERRSTHIPAGILYRPCAAPGSDAARGTFGLSLDPHNALHLFLLLPTLAGLAILGGSAAVWAILWRRPPGNQPGDRMAWLRYGLVGLGWWLALSVFLVLDLAGSVSLHLGLMAVYALCWSLVGLLVLHPRPSREKFLALILFLAALLTVRLIDWNSRKPFLKDLGQVQVGMTETETDQILADYMKGVSPLADVDSRGEVLSGVIAYRHTKDSWGNADVGMLTFENRRVVAIEFLPD